MSSTLLVILIITGWVIFYDQDEVHSLAATIAGLIAVLWFFIIVSLPIKLLLTIPMIFVYRKLHVAHK
jgi:Na+-transporting NADH:ubiquinone oxidoreductase subunit NqrB